MGSFGGNIVRAGYFGKITEYGRSKEYFEKAWEGVYNIVNLSETRMV